MKEQLQGPEEPPLGFAAIATSGIKQPLCIALIATAYDAHVSVQVHKARLEEGEERKLRAELRQLDARRSSVERAGLFHQALSGATQS